MTNRTFTMIKPEAVAAGHAGKIIDMITGNGFKIIALKYTRLSSEEAGLFYEVHKERPFYGELVDYMASGPIYRRDPGEGQRCGGFPQADRCHRSGTSRGRDHPQAFRRKQGQERRARKR